MASTGKKDRIVYWTVGHHCADRAHDFRQRKMLKHIKVKKPQVPSQNKGVSWTMESRPAMPTWPAGHMSFFVEGAHIYIYIYIYIYIHPYTTLYHFTPCHDMSWQVQPRNLISWATHLALVSISALSHTEADDSAASTADRNRSHSSGCLKNLVFKCLTRRR